jgi:DNA-binding NarL/FixJ family response regulator
MAVSYSINVVLIDDDINSCHIIEDLLNDYKRIHLLGYAKDISSFQLLVKRTKPDVALIDLRLEGPTDGLDALNWLSKNYPDVKTIMIY